MILIVLNRAGLFDVSEPKHFSGRASRTTMLLYLHLHVPVGLEFGSLNRIRYARSPGVIFYHGADWAIADFCLACPFCITLDIGDEA